MNVSAAVLAIGLLALGIPGAAAQSTSMQAQTMPEILTETGQVLLAGKPVPYLIRHLPVNSFPELPPGIADLLNVRGCTIPQTYEARRPENVVHASLERAGSSDWAVLCSTHGSVSLLVFLEGSTKNGSGIAGSKLTVLATALETQRLQPYPGGQKLGFNWGIDPASPEQVHQARTGMGTPPAQLDHDALADSVVDHRTIFHFYATSAWTVLPSPE